MERELRLKDFKHFGDWLRAEMRDQGYTTIKLSEECGINRGTISRYLNGYSTPSIRDLYLILDVLDLEMEIRPRKKGLY